MEAIILVDSFLTPKMNALEFGSGGSSLWIGERVSRLTVREHDLEWSDATRKRLADSGQQNCEVEWKEGEQYYTLEGTERFDFAVVDGEYRWKCLEALSERMSPGGLIYFDNSDSDKDSKHYAEFGLRGTRYAQKVVANFERSGRARVKNVHGMINGELYAGSGSLIYFYRHSRAVYQQV
jgi:predicted O-methyltransferase YrrM